MKTLFTLFAIMTHDNGTPPDYFVIDYNLTYQDCIYAEEGLLPVMAEGIILSCEAE